MSEMVERVARAIAETRAYGVGWEERLARAAIAAMREPTEAMQVAEGIDTLGCKARLGEYLDDWDAAGVWQAMIDAALAEGTEAAQVVS